MILFNQYSIVSQWFGVHYFCRVLTLIGITLNTSSGEISVHLGGGETSKLSGDGDSLADNKWHLISMAVLPDGALLFVLDGVRAQKISVIYDILLFVI